MAGHIIIGMDSAYWEAAMPWREVSVMKQRREFIELFRQEGVNRHELCRRFGISRTVAYKWLARFAAGDGELADRSRRPHTSPSRSAPSTEELVLGVRDAHPAWGARKIGRCLERVGHRAPALSTMHAILCRHARVCPPAGTPGEPYRRFEMEAPNLLWQMDFKGHVELADGSDCHPLTVIDDHSRFTPCLAACRDEKRPTVQGHLQTTFRRYGLPEAMFVDNGGPWGYTLQEPWTKLGVWLLKLGVRVIHSRPRHPQSRGKNERFHRTLKAEVFAFERFRDLAAVQRAFDRWRDIYNLDRPHEALGQHTPASRYRPSRAQCRSSSPRSSTTITRSSAPSPPPRPMSASKATSGRCRKRSAANASRSGRSRPMAVMPSASPPTPSQPST
jgi:transposase InsO family protein